MSADWCERLRVDPIPTLLESGDAALGYFVRRDLLEQSVEPIQRVWELPEARKLFRKQQPDGAWDRAAGQKKHPAINYKLIETWKQFRFLIAQYGFTRADPATARAAEFLFACQTEAGDFRGMLANQYANYYTGALLGLLIQAGYADDPRVERGFEWLLKRRQDDLGWSESLITHPFDRETLYRLTSQFADPVELDRSKPFSHNSTGMVLRAFAAHPQYRQSPAAHTAANLQKARFFQPDLNSSYQAASYWVRFQFPFWWNNLVAALDSISFIDPTRDAPMQMALDWLREHQEPDGLWKADYAGDGKLASAREQPTRLWVSLSICRVLKRLEG